jgi:glycosyltransferase involved in cell wall biosynthesis
MLLVSPSLWLANELSKSFLKDCEISVINNGIDLDVFKPADKRYSAKYFHLQGDMILLGVASVWTVKKGLGDFVWLRSLLGKNVSIVLVGLTKKQIAELPEGILGISRTENIHDLAKLYAAADLFINPTYVDNFPTTNIEALACGTPVITYDTGGSAEIIDENTGIKVSKGNINELVLAIEKIRSRPSQYTAENCRKRAEALYNASDRYRDYLNAYESLMKNNHN